MADASNLNQGVQTYIEKTLYDADDFLANFSMLREENEHLKKSNETLQQQLEKLQQEVQQLHIDKQNLENQLLREREQHKEALWNTKSDIQRIQEERLEWKEKYLDVCMKGGSKQEPVLNEKQKTWKFKQSLLSTGTIPESIADEFYSNLSSTFGLNENEDQPVQPIITNQLWDPETKRFECKECKATFRQFSDLKSHIDKNRCVKYTFQCPECSIVFSNATSFTKHLKYHVGKTISCEYCGDKFMHEKGLQRHVKMYHTEFNQHYSCQLCSKLFNRKTLLENHIRRHFDYRPFKCNSCEKSFKTRQYLTGHINGVHKNDKQFVCDKCDARFSWRTTWKRHIQSHAIKTGRKKKKSRADNSAISSATPTTLSVPNLQQMVHSVVLNHVGIPIGHNVVSISDPDTSLANSTVQLSHSVVPQMQNHCLTTLSHLSHNQYSHNHMTDKSIEVPITQISDSLSANSLTVNQLMPDRVNEIHINQISSNFN
ncbi:zinc finger protein 92 isoform X5 [Hydra vulgaris]|uniref:Zinc finger protein 92 isoform X5 n=1 Tax=Hydra vulgaris TaxID=6087 RepID=A0ABM4CIH2_HYDVU